jgi:hypothetical protein
VPMLLITVFGMHTRASAGSTAFSRCSPFETSYGVR